eukprot:g5591.t1
MGVPCIADIEQVSFTAYLTSDLIIQIRYFIITVITDYDLCLPGDLNTMNINILKRFMKLCTGISILIGSSLLRPHHTYY